MFGQFLTPSSTASFMASLFTADPKHCRLLDAGAGIGTLSSAFLDRWESGDLAFYDVELDAFELDADLLPFLNESMIKYKSTSSFRFDIHHEDFILAAVEAISGGLFATPIRRYTHAILNPPYKKINSKSPHRLALRRVGIETVNLYSAFVALVTELTEMGGQIVAIIPRSFCNGPYYRPFRQFILKRTAIRRIHLFDSRTKQFKDDNVLQENVIVFLERGQTQQDVTISTSTDDSLFDLNVNDYSFDQIVLPEDPEQIIHIPNSRATELDNSSGLFGNELKEIGINVSTGPVVDFRLRTHLREMPSQTTVPLLYPLHFSGWRTNWPVVGSKKPNAIERNPETEKWLYPRGYYCVVRRFSSKEEKRRIVASVIDPSGLGDVEMLGFENHLNVFHSEKQGLPEDLAFGLAMYLNTTTVDNYFRRFNGHTQVNATDLRILRYPSREMLIELGNWSKKQQSLSQEEIDKKLNSRIHEP